MDNLDFYFKRFLYNENMDRKNLIIFIITIVAVAAGVYYFSYKKGYKTGFNVGKEAGIAASKTTAGQAVANPLEAMPSTNPFEKAVNPFKELYKNPFK